MAEVTARYMPENFGQGTFQGREITAGQAITVRQPNLIAQLQVDTNFRVEATRAEFEQGLEERRVNYYPHYSNLEG